jgi:hypothetical protein
MARAILVVAPSGSGKTTSGRNLDPERGIWIVPEDKELPFRGFAKNFRTLYKKEVKEGTSKYSLKSNYIPEDYIPEIKKILIDIHNMPENQIKARPIDYVIIDTFTYAMLRSVLDVLEDDNWSKYKKFAKEFKDLVDTIKKLRNDFIVVIMSHEDVTQSKSTNDTTPTREFKIPSGQFTREAITPEGLFTTVFWAEVQESDQGNKYVFRTQKGNGTQAKSPLGMFDDQFIPNDLVEVFAKFEEFYN